MHPVQSDRAGFSTWFPFLTLLLALLLTMPAGPALAGELSYSYGGDAEWFTQSATSHDGIEAQQSGAISHSQSSWMETTVTGPGAVRFWWKVSSESCCDALRFSIDGVQQAEVRGEKGWQSQAFTVPAGSHTLRWSYTTDSSVLSGSNAGWVDEISFTPGTGFDFSAPVTSATPEGHSFPPNQSVSLSCSDNVGCTGTWYCLGSDCDPATPYSGPITLSSSSLLRFYSADAAGNSEAVKSAYYSIDTTPPSTHATLSSGSYVGPRQVSLFCSDSGTGCQSTYYCLGSGCSPTTLFSSPIALSASTVLRYYSTDRAGNSGLVETDNYSILQDTTPPSTTVSSPGGTYGILNLYLSCSDGNGTGCAATYYCLGSGCTPSTTPTSLIAITESTDLRFYSLDKAGNEEQLHTVSYLIDKTAPITTANPAGGSYPSAPLVTLSCNDGAGVGCRNSYYCLGENCSPTTPYTGPIAINDSTTLRFYSTDEGNNAEAVLSQRYLKPAQEPRTIAVPESHPSIQAAIDSAYNGDTVLVAPGTYPEKIDFKGKGITVRSSAGPALTIISGNRAGAVVTFATGESTAAVLDGFSIRNGANEAGGGIAIENASPTVINNVISGNSASWGAGIDIDNGSPVIRDNVISNNSAPSFGGGICIRGGSAAQIIDNTISENWGDDGGGLALWGATTSLIKGNLIKNNRSSSDGAALYSVNQSRATLVQNVFAYNNGESGVFAGSSEDSFLNNTFVDNVSREGASIWVGSATFTNNIVTSPSGQSAVYRHPDYLATFRHNMVYAPAAPPYAPPLADQHGSRGNQSLDPRLNAPQSSYFGLQGGSPAIDAGDGTVSGLPGSDFAGEPRVLDGSGDGTAVVDMGAFEFDRSRPVATLQGVPAAFLSTDSLTLAVGGTGVVSYRYSLDGAPFSASDIAAATPLTLTGLANGRHSLVLLGKNAEGIEQSPSSATAAAWVVNTESSNLTFSYGGDAPWTVQALVSRDGIAYQSGAVGPNQTSWMETTVTGPGAIGFWWKSSQRYAQQLTFSIDGASTRIGEGTDWQYLVRPVSSGSHTLRWTYTGYFYSAQDLGWVDQIEYRQGADLDATPPTTSATPAGGLYGSGQSVVLSCSDGSGSGCAGTFYCLGTDCTPSTPYSGAIAVTAPLELRFYSTDQAGHAEAVRRASYSFDTAPPITYSTLSAGSYTGPRQLQLICNDSGLGCAATYYCLGSGCTPSTPYSSTLTIASSTELRFLSVDQAGSRETVESLLFTISPDLSAPTTTANPPPGTYSPSALYLSCNDGDGSGCATTYYCLGAGCTPSTVLNSSYIEIFASTEVGFYSVDRSGNSEAVTRATYLIDAVAPKTTPSIAGGIYATPQQVALSCSDQGGSVCSATYFCLGDGCSPTQRYTGPITISSSTYLSYRSYDEVGHDEPLRTERYTIRSGAPVTIQVPAQQATIQGAIDAAQDGDTVQVAPGTYRERIDFKGKAITVQSSDGPEVTIIDGERQSSVVSFKSSEWNTSVLNGFTITNGGKQSYGNGSGIRIEEAAPTVSNNKIVQNEGCEGSGIFASGAPIISNNLIAENSTGTCSGWGGGGIMLWGKPGAQILDNTIANNQMASGSGGGIHLRGDGKTLVRGNVIRNNGGAGVDGGGIYLAFQSDAEIVQNLIAGNSAVAGGGLHLSRGTLLANTIVDNEASRGSALYFDYWYDAAQLINNVITGKNGTSTVYLTEGRQPPRMTNNVLFAASGDLFGGALAGHSADDGNIYADPLLAGSAFGYYGLQPGSRAIDAGVTDLAGLPATDLSGAPRIIGGGGVEGPLVDIGAYEFDPNEPRAQLANAPSGATQSNSASITVGGAGMVSYRYAVDGGPFSSADTPVAVPITLTGLAGGSHAVAVIGKSASRAQRPSSATVAQWNLDTFPPVTTATPAGGSYSEAQSVTLACGDASGSGCAGTFYCLGGECTPDTPYTGPITVSAPAGLSFYSRDTFGNQETVQRASYNFVATLSGRITDSASGAGIAGAGVNVFSAATGAHLGYGYADPSGAYRVQGLPAGTVKLQFWADQYLGQWYNGMSDRTSAASVTLAAPGETAGIDVALVRGGSITGTVTDNESGAGIGNVYVTAYNAVTGSLLSGTSTTSSGAYTVPGLATGSYKLRFQGPSSAGYLVQWYGNGVDLSSAAPVSVAGAATTGGIDIALRKGGELSGTVTDASSGAAIAGVRVTLAHAASGELLLTSVYTDAAGGYHLVGLSGSYKVNFSGSGYRSRWYGGNGDLNSASAVTVTPGQSLSGIDTVLTRGGSISGTVTDAASGAPLSQVLVQAFQAESGSWAGSQYSDSTGAYSLTGLDSGSYKLSFTASGYAQRWSGGASDQAGAASVAVSAPDATTGVDLALIRGGSITGRVTDGVSGAGIEWTYIVAFRADSNAWAGSAYSDSAGNYSISGLASGSYRLLFRKGDYLPRWSGDKGRESEALLVQVVAPDTVSGVDVALVQGGAIEGTVTDRASGEALPQVQISVYSAASGQFAGYHVTDLSGGYRVAGLPSGDYRVRFSASGHSSQWFDAKSDPLWASTVSVTAPDTSAGIDAALEKGGSVSGAIVDRSTGVGIANCSVALFDRATGEFAGGVQTDDQGAYTLTGLASGSYRVRIDPPSGSGYLGRWYGSQPDQLCPEAVTVTAPNATTGVDASLDLGGSISGRATDATTGAGIPELYISLSAASLSGPPYQTATADASGAYTLGGVPSGQYSVSFQAPDYLRSSIATPVTVSAPDAVTGVDVTLVRGGGISGQVTLGTGAGVSAVMVFALDATSRAVAGSAMSDASGRYRIRGVPSGDYSLFYDASRAGSYLFGYPGGGYSGGVVSFAATGTSAGILTAQPLDTALSSLSPGLGKLSVPAGLTLAKESAVAQRSLPAPVASAVSAPVSSVPRTWTPVPEANRVAVLAPAVTGGIDFGIEPLGAISGRVSEKVSDEPVMWIQARAYDSISGAEAGSALSEPDGSYTIRGLPSGGYRVRFSSGPGREAGYLDAWYRSADDSALSSEVSVQSGETSLGIDARLARGGGISGTISVNSCPGPGQVKVSVYDLSGAELVGEAWVNPDFAQSFIIPALPAGSYKLLIESGEEGYLRQWYPNKSDAASAEPIAVSAGAVTGGVQATLSAGGGSISGTLTGDSGCSFPAGSAVRLYDWYSGGLAAETVTSPGGAYRFARLPDASYKLQFSVNGVERWYRDQGETAQASPVVLSGGATLTGIDLVEACTPDGALNGTGRPTILDAFRALRLVVGLDPLLPDHLAHYDVAPVVNGVPEPDGVIDISDAILILQKAVSASAATAPY